MYGRMYYAHSLRIYGTVREKEELRFLSWRCWRVINPNGKLPNGPGWAVAAYSLIKKGKGLIFSEYKSYIGKGVATEIGFAFELGLEVYLLRGWKLFPITSDNIEMVGINWAIKWAKVVLS